MRKLTLKTDRLADLTTDQLALVAGADGTAICITDPCITRPVTGIWCLIDSREGCA